ncbi:MAG: biotin/lipoyl-containing protein [Kiritimatiellia bacterium]|nr:biotin/lipoyl-containing protein [Kiritimatiellia bacterium]
MATQIIMPQLGENIETGTITEWMKKENETVRKGEIICAVEADKGVLEIEAEQDGVLLKILVREGEEARVLAPIGYIGQPGEKI